MNIKIFTHRNLELIENIEIVDFLPPPLEHKLYFHDLNVMMHAPNAYQVYLRVQTYNNAQLYYQGYVVMIEIFTDGPAVFTKLHGIDKGHDFKLLTQAKGMYLTMRF